ncbi:FIST C-terminal domain-containing protein [Pseudenhygromyxa sp. WMMC2535]|uniref:FIST signal transduction protein n=1 Tax=Pseudenhygromyxa sp. WMMC2535 TaxID=2712867 RepID=UPI00155816F6|nr:FIST N-terminal domain-containing protein [Pseudenhygromyxa sp. WMMC2535]NVB40257.1 FIST C-terminal domain-containing protein [Pseudenhygromyxa sp. WMMC2535]
MAPGARVVHATRSEPGEIVDELRREFGAIDPVAVLFFASSALDFGEIAAGIAAAFPGACSVGCTSGGEVGPAGCTTGRVVALALAAPGRAQAALLEEASQLRFGPTCQRIEALVAGFGDAPPSSSVLITLTDGLSGAEELLLAAAKAVAPDVALVGGSAADDFHFESTQVAVDGRVARGGAALLMLEPRREFAPIHLHHYERIADAIVVTEADPSRRLIARLNGFPAAAELVRAFGIDEVMLREQPRLALASAVFGVPMGSSIFLRSVMSVQGDALLMGGGVEEGTLMYPMRPGDLVTATSEGLARVLTEVPGAEAMLLFNCSGRLWEARASGRLDALAAAMTPVLAAGFSTYGEQYRHIQVNHTLTGLVFGRCDD